MDNKYAATVTIAAEAVKGDRIAIMSYEGTSYKQAALIGIHVNSTAPNNAGVDLDSQMGNKTDLSDFNPYYW